MYDAALLFHIPPMAEAAREYRRELVRIGGHMEWSGMPAGMTTTLTQTDLLKIASWTMLPSEMQYVILLTHISNQGKRRPRENVQDIFVKLSYDFGVTEQPIISLDALCNKWKSLCEGRSVLVSEQCLNINMVTLPPSTRQYLRGASQEPAGETRRAYDLLDNVFGGTPPQVDPNDMSEIARSTITRTSDASRVSTRQREAFLRRQEAAAQVLAAEPELVIDWYDTERWHIINPNPELPGRVWTYSIHHMEDQHLWQTLIYLVRECSVLFVQYSAIRGGGSLGLESKTWLKGQPAFRALLQEAITRKFTFPPDVYRYLRQYALADGASNDIEQSPPWRDSGATYQTEQLEDFLDEPLDPEEIRRIEEEHGKALRDIDLG